MTTQNQILFLSAFGSNPNAQIPLGYMKKWLGDVNLDTEHKILFEAGLIRTPYGPRMDKNEPLFELTENGKAVLSQIDPMQFGRYQKEFELRQTQGGYFSEK